MPVIEETLTSSCRRSRRLTRNAAWSKSVILEFCLLHLLFFFRNGFSRMCQIGTFHKLENFVLKKDVAAQICPDVQGGIPFLSTAEFRQRLFAESKIVGQFHILRASPCAV